VEFHERSICQDQGQRADQPDRTRQFDRTSQGMKTQPCRDVCKNPTGQKRQRTGESNRLRFNALPPDFRIRVAVMEPIAGKETVG
jgi:hypothetical protein